GLSSAEAFFPKEAFSFAASAVCPDTCDSAVLMEIFGPLSPWLWNDCNNIIARGRKKIKEAPVHPSSAAVPPGGFVKRPRKGIEASGEPEL
ncbi:MAG: hypothetical protein Q4C02_07845, partial [Eubacteriales bacterium]|nr:hypothetical protein [Eubacteriales bacterium]